MKINKGSSLDLTSQYTQGNIAKIKELSDEEDLIQDYCKKVSEKTNDFDESLIKVMSDSISALTSRDCFVMVSKNIKDGNLIFSEDEDKIFYSFNIKETNFYVLLYWFINMFYIYLYHMSFYIILKKIYKLLLVWLKIKDILII